MARGMAQKNQLAMLVPARTAAWPAEGEYGAPARAAAGAARAVSLMAAAPVVLLIESRTPVPARCLARPGGTAAAIDAFCWAKKLEMPEALGPCGPNCLPMVPRTIGAIIPRSHAEVADPAPEVLDSAVTISDCCWRPTSEVTTFNPRSTRDD